jgi:hypothetical protein
VSEIKEVQEVVGVRQDGIWGPKTVEAVYVWQGLRCMEQDGKVGPNTLAAVETELSGREEPTNPNIPVPTLTSPLHGIWCDDRRSIIQETYWDVLDDHGVNSVALMIEGHNEKWNPWYSTEDIEKIVTFADKRRMYVGVTDWPYPNERWMLDMHATLRPWFEQFPLSFYESDLEGNWLAKRVKGFAHIDAAGDQLVDTKRSVVEGTNARVECTTFTAHTENGRAADVAPYMDRIFAQAYGVRHRRKKNIQNGRYDLSWLVPWSHTYGPGNMVKHTLDRSLQVPGVPSKVKLCCGLPAYDQKWPGHTAQEAMESSYNAALAYQPSEVRWWSFKWVFGRFATSYGKPFFMSIR